MTRIERGTRYGRAATFVLVAGLTATVLTGCGGDDEAVAGPSAEGTPMARPAATAGPFDAEALIPAGYTVTSVTAMPLGPAGEPEYQVVVAADKGAVKGGTQNVHVFAYRDAAWTEVFDAAEEVVPFEMQGDVGAPESDQSPDPVLNQKHWIEKVAVQPVRFGLAAPSLVIYGEDKDNPHVLGVLAVVDFVTEVGRAHLDHFEMAQDLGAPKVTGSGNSQQLSVPNWWYPWVNGGDPAEYTQTVGLTEDEGVAVIADSRPWVGVWVSSSQNPGVMVSQVIAGGPADGTLQVGDRIVSVAGNTPKQGLGPELLTHEPGEEVTFSVDRDGQITDVVVTLGDMSKAPSYWETPKPATIGAEVAPLSGRPGVAVTSVAAGGPAAAAGLQKGDAIRRVGAVRIAEPSDLDAALSGRAGQKLDVEVERGAGRTETVTVTPKAAGPDGDVQVGLL